MAEKNVSSANEKELKAVESKKKAKKEPMSFKKIVTIIIIVLLALLMVGGVTYVITLVNQSKAEKQSTWGSYNGESIMLENGSVFYNTLVNDENFQTAYLTGDYNTLMNSYLGAYQQQVVFTAVSQEAKAAGLVAPQDLVDDMILAAGVYNDADGVFSAELYNSTSDANKIAVNNYYKNLLPYNTVLIDLQSAIISEQETAFVGEIAGKTRSFDYFLVDYSVYPDDKAIAFAQENGGLFDSIEFSVLSCTTEENANKAYADLQSGIQWKDVVAVYSEDSYKDYEGYVGVLPAYAILPNLVDTAEIETIRALEVGSFSAPIANPTGAYSIYMLESKILPPDYEDALTLKSIKYYITSNELDDVTPYIDAAVEPAIELAKTDFEKAAESVKAEIVHIDAAANNVAESSYIGGLSYYDENAILSSVAADSAVSRELYTADLGYVAGPYQLADVYNTYVIAKVTDINNENQSMSSITTMFYAYYASAQTVNDRFYAIFNSDKFVDNFYAQFISTVLGNLGN